MEKTCSIRHWRPVLEALAGHGHTWWIYIVWYDQADQTDPLYVIVDSWLPLAGSHDSPAESVAVGLMACLALRRVSAKQLEKSRQTLCGGRAFGSRAQRDKRANELRAAKTREARSGPRFAYLQPASTYHGPKQALRVQGTIDHQVACMRVSGRNICIYCLLLLIRIRTFLILLIYAGFLRLFRAPWCHTRF